MKSNPTLSQRFLPGFTPVTSPMEAPIACQAVPLSTQFFLAWASTSSRKMGHGVTQCPHLYNPECGGLQRWVVNALFDDLLTKRRQNINSSSLFSENSLVKLSDRLCGYDTVMWIPPLPYLRRFSRSFPGIALSTKAAAHKFLP